MRSACSAARSRSLETFLLALANCLLACPTDLATVFASRSVIDFGTFTPSTFFGFGCVRALSATPARIPAAAAPAASAGRLALPATPLIVPPMPLPLLLAALERLELLLAGFERLELLLAGFERLRLLELFARDLPLELELRFAELDRLAAPLRAVLDDLLAVPEVVRVPEVLDWAIRAFPFVREPRPGHTRRVRRRRSGKDAPNQA
jgi:hypothetical protein